MSTVNIESLSSLQKLLQYPPEGLYIDIYQDPDSVQFDVKRDWRQFGECVCKKVLSDSDDLISGYNFETSINQGAYFYIFPGKGKGNLTLYQQRHAYSNSYYSDASKSYSDFYGIYAINGQTDYINIQTEGVLMIDPDNPSSNSLKLSIKRRSKLAAETNNETT